MTPFYGEFGLQWSTNCDQMEASCPSTWWWWTTYPTANQWCTPHRGLLNGPMIRLARSAHSQIMIVLEASLNTQHRTHSLSTTWRCSVVSFTFQMKNNRSVKKIYIKSLLGILTKTPCWETWLGLPADWLPSDTGKQTFIQIWALINGHWKRCLFVIQNNARLNVLLLCRDIEWF